jgi:hypothetical protein
LVGMNTAATDCGRRPVLPAQTAEITGRPGVRARCTGCPFLGTGSTRAVRSTEEDRRVCRSPACTVDVAPRRSLPRRGVERHTGARRRPRRLPWRQPGSGAGGDWSATSLWAVPAKTTS